MLYSFALQPKFPVLMSHVVSYAVLNYFGSTHGNWATALSFLFLAAGPALGQVAQIPSVASGLRGQCLAGQSLGWA